MTPTHLRGICLPDCIGPAATPKRACLLTDRRTDLSCQPNLKSLEPKRRCPVRPQSLVKAALLQQFPLRAWSWLHSQSPGPRSRPGSPTGWILRPASGLKLLLSSQLRLYAGPLYPERKTSRQLTRSSAPCRFLPVEGLWGGLWRSPLGYPPPPRSPLAGVQLDGGSQ